MSSVCNREDEDGNGVKSQFETMMENPEFRKEFAVESLVLEATEVVSRLMHEQGLTKADLARRLGKSRAWVTQLLNGSANMTLRTLAEVLVALDAEARVEAKPGAWQAKKKLLAKQD